MSAKSLKHEHEIFYTEAKVEKLLPRQIIFGMAGNQFKVKEVMPCEGGYFVAFENAPPMRLPNNCGMMLKGVVVL